MAIGGKLGKVFGAIGSGLSFIPGPWSALGMAFSAASTAATAVGEKREREEQEQAQQGQAAQPQQAIAQNDNSRIEAGQMAEAGGQQAQQPQQAPIFRQAPPSLGNYQLQIDQEIANMLIKDAGGLYGD